MKKNNKKVLFVIPAYNEEENIKKVLEEIKKDASFADVLVINDCSKDNTKKIVLESGVKCIDNIFNMRYAWAVQTGIKYAYQNNYDYVVQIDADGQHIAKEAVKLVECSEKENTFTTILNCCINQFISFKFIRPKESNHSIIFQYKINSVCIKIHLFKITFNKIYTISNPIK